MYKSASYIDSQVSEVPNGSFLLQKFPSNIYVVQCRPDQLRLQAILDLNWGCQGGLVSSRVAKPPLLSGQ